MTKPTVDPIATLEATLNEMRRLTRTAITRTMRKSIATNYSMATPSISGCANLVFSCLIAVV